MKYLNTCVMLLGLSSFAVCAEAVKGEFFIMQNWEKVEGKEIKLENKPFTLSTTGEHYSYVFSKNKIDFLEGKKQILKISGSVAQGLSHAMLYEADDVYTDAAACKIHYGNQGKECQEFIEKKKELGLEGIPAYSFTHFTDETKKHLIESINEVKLSEIKDESYYIYFFTHIKDVGEVETLFAVDKIKININAAS